MRFDELQNKTIIVISSNLKKEVFSKLLKT